MGWSYFGYKEPDKRPVLEVYFPDPVDKAIFDGLINKAREKQKEIDVLITKLEGMLDQDRIQDPALKQRVTDTIREQKKKRITV